MAQPVQPVDRLCSSGRVPVEGGQKVSLSPSDFLFPVEMILFPVEVWLRTDQGPVEDRLRSGRGPVEVRLRPNGHFSYPLVNRSTPSSTGRTPKLLVWLFSSIKRFQSSLFKELNLLKSFLIIFEPWKSIF